MTLIEDRDPLRDTEGHQIAFQCSEHRREHQLSDVDLLKLWAAAGMDRGTDVTDTVDTERHAWARDVVAILAALPAHQAHALRLLYFEHLTDHEAAIRMGVAIAHARTAAADGLRNLANVLQATPRIG